MFLHRIGILLTLGGLCLLGLVTLEAQDNKSDKKEEQQARDALRKAEEAASKAKLLLAKLQGRAEQARKEANEAKQILEQKQKLLAKAKTKNEKKERQAEVNKAKKEYEKQDAEADRLAAEVKQAQQIYQLRQADVRAAQARLDQIVGKKPVTPPSIPRPIPVNGVPVPELAAFDQAMQKFMGERSIPGGTLAVMKKGRLVLAHGYGHADEAKKVLLEPDAPLRLAGLSRVITAAAIHKLARAGKLRLQDRLVDLLTVTPPAGQTLEPRWKDITIQHLLEDRGGWDSEAAFDPLFESIKICKELGKDGPATTPDIISYMAAQPLQGEPGSKSVPSHFGYLLLGRVIEKVSGKRYVDYVRVDLLQPLGIRSIEQGKTLPKNRHVREPAYFDSSKGINIVQPTKKGEVPAPDGTFYLEALDSAVGLIGSAPDYARFMQSYQPTGEPRKAGASATGILQGSLPGSRTLALWHGDVDIVVLFNQRSDSSGLPYDVIADLMRRTADGIKTWPR